MYDDLVSYVERKVLFNAEIKEPQLYYTLYRIRNASPFAVRLSFTQKIDTLRNVYRNIYT